MADAESAVRTLLAQQAALEELADNSFATLTQRVKSEIVHTSVKPEQYRLWNEVDVMPVEQITRWRSPNER